MVRYPFQKVEEKWSRRWKRRRSHEVEEGAGRKKFYCLEMLPYPSGEIHMGHVRNYAIGDAVARLKRMQGFQVLHPIGFDSFGLPAENAAIERGIPPSRWTETNIRKMRRQLQRLGFSYSWEREIASHRPEYYRWNQWFFLKMIERGLAYRSHRPVNWCPSCETVLANEQVIDGLCWRCNSPVHRRPLEQWFLRITDYAEELLEGLDHLQGWPERVRAMQRHWIGKSRGATVSFPLSGKGEPLSIFTTRLDTIYGATFLVMAPEHPRLREILGSSDRAAEVEDFAKRQIAASLVERTAPDAEKLGIDTGQRAVHPFTGEPIPIWVANFVLGGYGTGVIMAVPAHDARDHAFARQYRLPIRPVILPEGCDSAMDPDREAFIEEGILVDSGPFTGLASPEARQAMAAHARERGFGDETVHYRLNDWGISRQRFWGTPIPVVYCDGCGVVPLRQEDLPVRLPARARLRGEGGSPLEHSRSFLQVTCHRCGSAARRETDTMDTFFDSSGYFLRYTDPGNAQAPFSREAAEYWMPIDLYIGGIEHATLHLIYFRFFTKVLRDLGLIRLDEPAKALLTQGMVVKDGAKMSKSQGNVVSPDEMVQRFGADATRLFCLFAAPPEKDLEWSEQGAEGCFRFLQRIHRLFEGYLKSASLGSPVIPASPDSRQLRLRRKTHRTIRRVTVDLDDRLHLNTAISAIMELTNEIQAFVQEGPRDGGDRGVVREALSTALLLLSPLAPHLSSEILDHLLKPANGVHAWPEADPDLLREEEANVVIQVNGRVRGQVKVPADSGEEEVYRLAASQPRIAAHLEGRSVRRRIFLPGRLLNIVVGESAAGKTNNG